MQSDDPDIDMYVLLIQQYKPGAPGQHLVTNVVLTICILWVYYIMH